MSGIDVLLSRLNGVRPNGPDRWMARCPSHGDKSPSLSIRRVEDGRVLVHCFAGCGAADVVGAVGLTVSDLFEKPLAPHIAKLRRRDLGVSSFDVLKAMRHEVLTLGFIATSIAEGETDTELRERAQLASQRIYYALSLCDG